MARLQKYSTFSDNLYDGMVNALEARCARLVEAIAPDDITIEDVKALLVKDEDREVLFRASSLCERTVREVGTIWPVPEGFVRRDRHYYPPYKPDATLLFKFTEPVTYMFPSYTLQGPAIGQAPALELKISNWVEQRLEIGVEFARAKETVKYLNERLSSAAQVRYYFPSVITLLEDVGNENMLRRLHTAKIPKYVPNLGNIVRLRCREATEAIARTKPLPKQVTSGFVQLVFTAREYHPVVDESVYLI